MERLCCDSIWPQCVISPLRLTVSTADGPVTDFSPRGTRDNLASSDDMLAEHFYDVPEGEDYLAIYETIDRKRQEAKEFKVSDGTNILMVVSKVVVQIRIYTGGSTKYIKVAVH